MVARDHPRLLDEHNILRRQGRCDMPIRGSADLQRNLKSYKGFLRFTDQSISYVLTNAETLMRSFLHCGRHHDSRTVVWSYNFPLMISAFRLLRAIDFHPFSILPSLWISTRYLYPLNSSRKRTSNPKAGQSSLSGLSDSLDDAEASHIIKMIFAALIATVPAHDAETLEAATKLRASGNIAPCVTRENSPRYQQLVDRVLTVTSCFEDEMALSLVKKVVEAIMARDIHPTPSPVREPSYWGRKDAFQEAICFLIADHFKVFLAANQASPSLKDGRWVEDYVAEVAEELRQPLLVLVEWLRMLILKEWDGKARVKSCSAVGGALKLLTQIGQYVSQG